MKPFYKRVTFSITEFDIEDVITTSGVDPDPTSNPEDEISVDYGDDPPFGQWF